MKKKEDIIHKGDVLTINKKGLYVLYKPTWLQKTLSKIPVIRRFIKYPIPLGVATEDSKVGIVKVCRQGILKIHK